MSDTSNSGRSTLSIQVSIVRVVVLAVLVKMVQHRIWPWGMAEPWNDRMVYSLVNRTNDSLQMKYGRVQKIYERFREGQVEPLMKGPETVIFDTLGVLHIMNEEGFLIQLSNLVQDHEDSTKLWATSHVVADLGMGRPLGGCFTSNNTLYIADAHLGLTRLSGPSAKVELVSSRVMDHGRWTQILYANDVVVGPKTGRVYFTDSTNIAPDRLGTHSWDTMYGAKCDCMRGSKTGRLLQYDPETDTVEVLARGFHFANGISIDKDERWIMFSETFSLRMQKYDLSKGTVRPIVNGGLTGYPDGLDCAWKGLTTIDSNLCYAAMPSSILPIMKLVTALPHPIDMLFRSLLLGLPKRLAPPIKPYGGIAVFDPEIENDSPVSFIQDPDGKDVGMITGITVHDNKLYLGSLKNDYIGVYHLTP